MSSEGIAIHNGKGSQPRRKSLRTSFAAGAAIGLAVAMLLALGSSADHARAQQPADDCVVVFEAIGGPEPFVVPPRLNQITVNAWGAQGGSIAQAPQNVGTGGLGGAALGTVLAVVPGETLDVVAGGAGGDVPAGTPTAPAPGGIGGGGDGGAPSTAHTGGGGGGASSVARGAAVLVIAGGGGGGAHGGFGGDGGLSGTDGTIVGSGATDGFGLSGGNGGTGGVGSGVGAAGTNGAAGIGGTGGNGGDGGGGGGGGAVGGGGGGGGTATAAGGGAGGGGGSSAAVAGAGTQFQTGARAGDGRVEITGRQAGCGPDLRISKRVSKKRVKAGGKVRWTITVRNVGRQPAINATICDRLHPRTTVRKRGGGRLINGKRLCWTIDRIEPGQRVRRSFKVKVDRNAKRRIRNRACVTGPALTRRCARAKTRVVKRATRRVSPVTG